MLVVFELYARQNPRYTFDPSHWRSNSLPPPQASLTRQDESGTRFENRPLEFTEEATGVFDSYPLVFNVHVNAAREKEDIETGAIGMCACDDMIGSNEF